MKWKFWRMNEKKLLKQLDKDVSEILNIITKQLIVQLGSENSSKFNRDLREYLEAY